MNISPADTSNTNLILHRRYTLIYGTSQSPVYSGTLLFSRNTALNQTLNGNVIFRMLH